VTLIDSITTLPPIGPDSTQSADAPFVIQISPDVPTATVVDATVYVADSMGFEQELPYSFVIGDERTLPTGPDSYGYYALDPYDQGGRSFRWVEIDPQHGGPGSNLNLGDDETRTVSLPFNANFYGQSYNRVSICSNGWIAFGNISSSAFSNRGIPDPNSPNNIVAGVWDDLNPRNGGSIAYGYDSLKKVFVVEWNNIPHYGSSQDRETFEILIFDPEYYGTPTGDVPIAIQYLTAPSQDDYTVGIENASGSIGIQYYYDGDIDPHAFPIEDSFAIYFTTATPSVSEDNMNRPLRLELAPAMPNPMSCATNIRFALPSRMQISLNVYDITGRHVRTLASGVFKAGYHTVRWDGTDDNGRRLPSGLYIYMLKTPSRNITRKLVLLK
jgi:hypothetical protein